MNLLGHQIDAVLRNANDGQTHGIPIGPDTSLVAAEILLSAIDQELLKRRNQDFRGFRYIDDYELSFALLRDAESVLNELQEILFGFELSLNPRKTKLTELHVPFDDDWAIRLAKFDIRDASSPVGQRTDILQFFSQAFELLRTNKEAGVVRYAVARVQNLNVATSAWRAFQNCIVSAIGADASSLARGLGTLHLVATSGKHAIAKQPLSDSFASVIQRHAPKGEGNEVAWALWGALSWSVPLDTESAKLISRMTDNVVVLLALHADAKGLFPVGALDKTQWQALANDPDILISEHWLLGYEADIQKWLVCPAVAKDPVFGPMQLANVRFYDAAQNIPQFPGGAKGVPGGSVADFYA